MPENPARKHPRYAVNLTVEYATHDAFVGNHVSNLSRGGLFIATRQPLPVQSELDLMLILRQEDERIRARGRVVWNYDIQKGTSHVVPGMGMKLLDMSREDLRRFKDYLATLARYGATDDEKVTAAELRTLRIRKDSRPARRHSEGH